MGRRSSDPRSTLRAMERSPSPSVPASSESVESCESPSCEGPSKARPRYIAVAGNIGCGKSTLLNLMGTLDSPSRGTVSINGKETGDLNHNDLALLRGQEIGFIFQLHHLLPQCSALENVLIPETITVHRERLMDAGFSSVDVWFQCFNFMSMLAIK